MLWIALATEDTLSEEVGLRLVAELGRAFSVQHKFRKGGNGYLKANLSKFCQVAERQPTLLITDLDNATCPVSLISEWKGRLRIPPQLFFRVAVREIESWLLADHTAMRKFLGLRSATGIPKQPDFLSDAKQTLLNLARKAPREIRNNLCLESGSVASQGLGYNTCLSVFIRDNWDPARAERHSDSLRRTRHRLRLFAEQV
ncbi:MAG: hypothetical protein WC722_09825 [Rhodospirillales bacterium]|jgi:hypothetical protein